MIGSFSISLSEIVSVYFKLAIGRHIQYCIDQGEYGYLLISGWTNYASWNHVIPKLECMISHESFIAHNEHVFNEISRKSTFYVFDTEVHLKLKERLERDGYNHIGNEIWLIKKLHSLIEIDTNIFDVHVVNNTDIDDIHAFVEGFRTIFEKLPSSQSEQLYLSLISHNKESDIHIYVKDRNKKIVGVASVYVLGIYAGVFNFAVSAQHRRSGVGSAMITYLEKMVQDFGCKYAFLQADNSSRQFFERMAYSRLNTGSLFQKS